MTIQFPDVSSYQAGLQIQPGTVFLWARATMNSNQVDSSYADFKSQAARLGVPFGAYHFLYAGNGSAQADHCFSVVGPNVPLFVDVESDGSSYPTTSDVNAFKDRYRALGGILRVQYYPKWYADSQGANLASTGLLTINAGYPGGYSDSSSEWNSYDGITPFQWQYSDNQSYGGKPVDFNAYKGSLAEYLTVISYPVAPPPPPPTTPTDDEETLKLYIAPRSGANGAPEDVFAFGNGEYVWVQDPGIYSDLQPLWGPAQAINYPTHAFLLATYHGTPAS
jgi:hypothetical protein